MSGNDFNKEIAEEYFNSLLDYRLVVLEEKRASSERFDKTLTTLASTAIGLTIAILKDLVPNPIPTSLIFLYASWASFALSLFFILLSHLASIDGRSKLAQQINQRIRTHDMDPNWEIGSRAKLFSYGSLLALFIGTASFFCFVYLNYGQTLTCQ